VQKSSGETVDLRRPLVGALRIDGLPEQAEDAPRAEALN
jgi:hypothetical protein